MSAGVVIVNFNCAPLALDAALSALGDDPDAGVVIVDNASTDRSVEYFSAMIEGDQRHIPGAPADEAPRAVTFAALGDCAAQFCAAEEAPSPDAKIVILRARANDGFAAGCNLGLEFLQRWRRPDWCLLLNPDALVTQGAMATFADRLEDPSAGLCGGTILRFAAPFEAQAFGGARLGPWSLLGRNLGAGLALADAPDRAAIEASLDYPLGAAMALRMDYFLTFGGLDERYFLYYEEADWARRGGAGRKPVWAPGAVVFHRHGAAAGSRQRDGGRGVLADYHMARSRMLFALKWKPWLAPAIVGLALGQAMRRVLRGRRAQARALIAGTLMTGALAISPASTLRHSE